MLTEAASLLVCRRGQVDADGAAHRRPRADGGRGARRPRPHHRSDSKSLRCVAQAWRHRNLRVAHYQQHQVEELEGRAQSAVEYLHESCPQLGGAEARATYPRCPDRTAYLISGLRTHLPHLATGMRARPRCARTLVPSGCRAASAARRRCHSRRSLVGRCSEVGEVRYEVMCCPV
jgi:hypothetical protein